MTRWEVLDSVQLCANWAELRTTKLRLTFADGHSVERWFETYDRGDGVALLAYDPARRHVLLGRQFRWPAAHRGDPEPHLVEVAAGRLEGASPEEAVRAEAEEELGLRLGRPKWLFALYMSPGSVTEVLHFFAARYGVEDVKAARAGLRHEGEEVEILDLPLAQALTMVADGAIRDAKTVILLQHAALTLMPEAP